MKKLSLLFSLAFCLVMYSWHVLYCADLESQIHQRIAIRDDVNAHIDEFDTIQNVEKYIEQEIVESLSLAGKTADDINQIVHQYRQEVVNRKLKQWLKDAVTYAFNFIRTTHDSNLDLEIFEKQFRHKFKIPVDSAYEPILNEYKNFLSQYWSIFKSKKINTRESVGTEDEEAEYVIECVKSRPLEYNLRKKEKLKHFIDDFIALSLMEYRIMNNGESPSELYLEELVYEIKIELKKNRLFPQDQEDLEIYLYNMLEKQLKKSFGIQSLKKRVNILENPVTQTIEFEIDSAKKIQLYIDKLFNGCPRDISKLYFDNVFYPKMQKFFIKNHLVDPEYTQFGNQYANIQFNKLRNEGKIVFHEESDL